ncbi:MAG: HAD-IIIA family hydrolase [Puniceicoccales bacterium]|nr:HAD-IIIA family hydrolase [Puniceicoccales bacterium]
MELLRRRRGIFLDRDGTLCENGAGYVGAVDKIVLRKGVRQAVAAMAGAGYMLFLVTNQSAVGRGFFPLGVAMACNRRLFELLGEESEFAAVCLSVGTPQLADPYRKPSPKFLWEMCAKYAMEPADCWVIGNSACDLEMAKNAVAKAIMICDCPKGPAFGNKPCQWTVPDLESAWAVISAVDGEDVARINCRSGGFAVASR